MSEIMSAEYCAWCGGEVEVPWYGGYCDCGHWVSPCNCCPQGGSDGDCGLCSLNVHLPLPDWKDRLKKIYEAIGQDTAWIDECGDDEL